MEKLHMKPHKTNGKLITFCGLDGCGKTTMIRRLTESLTDRGIPVFVTKQPTDDIRKSEIFRSFMDDPDPSRFAYRALSLMAAADRIQHTEKVILLALQEGYVVISDRYIYSCVANLLARGYEKDQWIYEIAKQLISPDLAFFLDVPVRIAVERVRMRPEEKDRYIDMHLQNKLYHAYQDIAKKNNGILLQSVENEEGTFHQILNHVEKILEV